MTGILIRTHPARNDAELSCFRRLAELCGTGEKFATRSRWAVLPTWASQIGWRIEGRAALGRRGPNSEIPDRRDRAARSDELRFRNEIVQKIPTAAETARRF